MAAGEALWSDLQQAATRSDRDPAEGRQLHRVAAEATETDTSLGEVRVGARGLEWVPHDYFKPVPPRGLVEEGMDRAWARKGGEGVRLVVSPSVEMSRFTPGLNPVADPYVVKVRDPDGRVVWSGPLRMHADGPAKPRTRTDTEQVAEVTTRVFRDAAGVVSGGVSDLPGVGDVLGKVAERVGTTDRSRVGEDRVTDIPVPVERFTRDGYTLSVEKPAHADAYARGHGGVVRDLHVRTVREMARDGAVTTDEARALTTRLQLLPWDWQRAPAPKPEDHRTVHRLLAEDGLRTWANERIRDMRSRQEGA